jgi:hypothetical protein
MLYVINEELDERGEIPLTLAISSKGACSFAYMDGVIRLSIDECLSVAQELNLPLCEVFSAIFAHECGHMMNHFAYLEENSLEYEDEFNPENYGRDEYLAWVWAEENGFTNASFEAVKANGLKAHYEECLKYDYLFGQRFAYSRDAVEAYLG